MITEISDTQLIDSQRESTFPKPLDHVPKGLAAVQDSMSSFPKAPKPPIVKRMILYIGILLVHFTTLTLRFFRWVFEKMTGRPARTTFLYEQLHRIVKKGKLEETRTFLAKHSVEENVAGYLFNEFLRLPEMHFALPEIMKGANISLRNDNGFFYEHWKEHPEAYQRISSHVYQDDECYAIDHFLFWLDESGQTRFQFEKSPLQGFFGAIDHVIDYLRYKRDNEQQGIMGSSPHTEEYSIAISVDPKSFQSARS